MKLLSLNIQNNLHNQIVLDFLKKEEPSVVCFQECLEEDFEFFKKELGFQGVFQAQGYIRGVTYPELKSKKYGIAIFTRTIIDSGYIFYAGAEENILKPFEEYMSDENFRKNNALV
jgi:mRNA deadenylase 3'-5' endonuclease subunit Ccr4